MPQKLRRVQRIFIIKTWVKKADALEFITGSNNERINDTCTNTHEICNNCHGNGYLNVVDHQNLTQRKTVLGL